MGCDIHLYTEKKIEDINKNIWWWCVDHWKLNDWKLFDKDESEYYQISIYNGRNYDLFAALADVRNSGYITPIDQPRGLPDDVSEVVKKEADSWDVDGHSHSWLTAKELFDYQKKYSTTEQSGMISLKQAKELDENGIVPSSWCQYTTNKNYTYRSWVRQESPVDGLVEAVKKKIKEEFHIYDFEPEEKQEKKIMEHLEEIRIVFFFDN